MGHSFQSSLRHSYLAASNLFFNRSDERRKLVIIIYHRIGSETASPLDMPLRLFETQLSYLQDNYRIVSLCDAIASFEGGLHGEDLAVLTFDDGYFDFYANALPILLRRNLPSLLYASTYFINSAQNFPWDKPFKGLKNVRPLTWHELQQISRVSLVTIGSHTHTHPRLDRITSNDLHKEIETSNRLFSINLGITPKHFAYPRGIPCARGDHIPALNGFKTLALAGWKPNYANSINLRNLLRIPAIVSPKISLFAHALSGAGWPFEIASRLKNLFTH